MRSSLAIGPLTNLQDARSSAAVGFDFVSFSLERGSHRMLAGNLIWGIATWLSGPRIVIELNTFSLDELATLGETISVHALSFPLEDWSSSAWGRGEETLEFSAPEIWLRSEKTISVQDLRNLIDLEQDRGRIVRVLLPGDNVGEQLHDVAEHIFLHFSSLAFLKDFLTSSTWMPTGFFLGQEAEEEFGLLNYEGIDDLMEVVAARFGE